MLILSIDAGTTGVTAQLVGADSVAVGRGYCEFEQHFPQPGWVEHDPEQIWQATLAAVGAALELAGVGSHAVGAIGITNQRETAVFWSRKTLAAPRKAIVWQDRRTADLLTDAKFADAREWVRESTGLPLDPYFSSSKILWVKRNDPKTWRSIDSGQVAIGTVDSYLIARISGGAAHITDATNASRTQLMNIDAMSWDPRLLELFEVPLQALPTIVPSWGLLSQSDPEHFLGIAAPITGCAGDQQAALFGQLGFEVGDAKCTYGTGAFLLQNTGDKVLSRDPKLLATVAYLGPNGERAYALEGSVFIAGAAVQWLRDGLGIIQKASDVDALALTEPNSDGVFFVPALSGLGAPFWDPTVRGSLLGLSRGTNRGHIARATLESIAFSVRALVDAMAASSGIALKRLKTDGGAAGSDLLLQTQANVLAIPVERPANLDTTGLGAAYLAGLGAGVWKSKSELVAVTGDCFEPEKTNHLQYQLWLAAVAATQSW
jgi:glycerol kinase